MPIKIIIPVAKARIAMMSPVRNGIAMKLLKPCKSNQTANNVAPILPNFIKITSGINYFYSTIYMQFLLGIEPTLPKVYNQKGYAIIPHERVMAMKKRKQSKGAQYAVGLFLLAVIALLFVLQGCGNNTVELSATPSEAAILTGAGSYSQGSAVTVKAQSAPGWEFVHWTQGGEVVAETEEYTFIFEGGTDLLAHLRPMTHSIETRTQGNGTVISSADAASHGSEVTLEAVPQAGYRFVHWLDAGQVVSTQAIYVFSADADRKLTAVFLPLKYSIDLEVDAGGHVLENWSLEPVKVTLEAIAQTGYEFFGWVDMDTRQEIETEAVLSLTWKGQRKIMARFRPELTSADGNSIIAVVGKKTSIGRYEPDDLVVLPDHISRKNRRVRQEVAAALELLVQAAAADGVDIDVDSGYRSFETQYDIFFRNARRDGIFKAETYSARPGQSEHQMGTAVDFGGTNKNYSSAYFDTAPGTWLHHNAHNFGFAMSYPRDAV